MNISAYREIEVGDVDRATVAQRLITTQEGPTPMQNVSNVSNVSTVENIVEQATPVTPEMERALKIRKDVHAIHNVALRACRRPIGKQGWKTFMLALDRLQRETGIDVYSPRTWDAAR